MRLRQLRIQRFRNIVDSGTIEIDPRVTCLVGKNESGKTALLHAFDRLLPGRGKPEYSILEMYPAWLEKKERQEGIELEDVRPVEAVYELDDDDIQALREVFGYSPVAEDDDLTVSRSYGGEIFYQLAVDEGGYVKHLVASIEWPYGTKTKANGIKTISGLREYAEELAVDEDEDHSSVGASLRTRVDAAIADDSFREAVLALLRDRLPKTFYFSDWDKLPYSSDISRILTAADGDLKPGELTARSLLRQAGAEDEYLTDPDYERRKRELENTANLITRDVLDYWSQNPQLRVEPDITQKTENDATGQHVVVHELKVRIRDERHSLSLPFDEHSTGFQWFFSFLAAFSEFERNDEPVILLLDEPALGLHARAQADFLRFIEERLAPTRQVIYTTHSPFMIEPGKLERVRLVEDRSQAEGTVVSADVTTTDRDTLFPLQGALGYDLVQNLFIAPDNLVVEGTSDFTYLRVLSDYLIAQGRPGLDDRWSIVPVGGADMVPTFVALLGNHLEVTVLVDAKKGGHQRLSRLVAQGLLVDKRLLTLGTIVGSPEADIEDLFEPQEYLIFFNEAFGEQVKESDLSGADPIVRRITRLRGAEFNHGLPADIFLRKRDEFLPALSEDTLTRFETLFAEINATLSS